MLSVLQILLWALFPVVKWPLDKHFDFITMFWDLWVWYCYFLHPAVQELAGLWKTIWGTAGEFWRSSLGFYFLAFKYKTESPLHNPPKPEQHRQAQLVYIAEDFSAAATVVKENWILSFCSHCSASSFNSHITNQCLDESLCTGQHQVLSHGNLQYSNSSGCLCTNIVWFVWFWVFLSCEMSHVKDRGIPTCSARRC